MSAGKSTYASKAVLDCWLRGVGLTAPAAVYVGLFTVAPSDAGGGTEVVGNGYVRRPASFPAPTDESPSTTSNAFDILFPVQTPAGYGEIVAAGVFDALSSGHLLYWNTCDPKTYAEGDQVKIAAGGLVVSED